MKTASIIIVFSLFLSSCLIDSSRDVRVKNNRSSYLYDVMIGRTKYGALPVNAVSEYKEDDRGGKYISIQTTENGNWIDIGTYEFMEDGGLYTVTIEDDGFTVTLD